MTPADQITEARCPNPHCGLNCEYCAAAKAAKKAAAKVMRKVRRILHRVKTHQWLSIQGKDETFSHLGFGRWIAYVGKFPNHEDDGCYAEGDTEDEAIVNLSIGMKWRLWNEETALPGPLNGSYRAPARDH